MTKERLNPNDKAHTLHQRFVFARRYEAAERDRPPKRQRGMYAWNHGHPATPGECAIFCRFRKRQVSRRLIPQLELGHYFVIRHPCFVILIARGMVEQSEIWTRMSVD